MIFVNTISELSYYHPSPPPLGCYSDAIFQPNDILLQVPALTALVPTFGVTINVCNTAGAFQEDGTANFSIYIGSFILAGQTYYFINLRCENYTDFMSANRCFTLNVVITDTAAGTIIFNKWTQAYNIITVSAGVFVPSILIDGVPTAPCIPGENPALCSGSEQYVKFSGSFDCFDAYTGEWYALGTTISGTPFAFIRFSYLPALFRDTPTEIQRITSINCRVQKTSYTGQYLLKGNVAFPVWKMKEIQGMLRGNHLYVDDVEYQTEETAKPFTQLPGLPKNCQYLYQFALPMQDCFKWQIFGCVRTCEDLASYYMFPTAFERIYDDSMRPVAIDVPTLLIYFESIPGTTVASLPLSLPCQNYATLRVVSTGVLPKFLYADATIPQQRIYPKQLALTATDLTPLCNGVTNTNQVPIPDITGENDEQIVVQVPDITGEDDIDANYYTMQIAAPGGWTLAFNPTSGVNYQGEATLNLSLSTTDYAPPYANMEIVKLLTGAPSRDVLITSTDNGNMPPSSTLLVQADGSIFYTGDATFDDGMGMWKVELFMIKYFT